MIERGASDLHLTMGQPPRLRQSGQMTLLEQPALGPERMAALLWPICPPKSRREFEADNDTDFAYEVPGLARFRCNYFKDRSGMGAVFRQIPTKIPSMEQLGLPREIVELCWLSKGLVVVTGPTGSGKSTTLAAIIDFVNEHRSDHIITIEDPIEFVHQNKRCLINQREVGTHTRGFKRALRAALREDPDIVLVGEMRDLETIGIAHRDRRDRAPRLRHAAHDDRRLDRRPHHRPVPGRPADADPRHALGDAQGRHRADALPQARRRARRGLRGAHGRRPRSRT